MFETCPDFAKLVIPATELVKNDHKNHEYLKLDDDFMLRESNNGGNVDMVPAGLRQPQQFKLK